jgi:hypothetical protein
MQIPFINGPAVAGYLPKNLYFTTKKIYGRDALVKRPGLKEFVDLGTSAPVRGIYATDEAIFTISAKTLFKIDTFGNVEDVGTLEAAGGRHCFMAFNGEQLAILDDGILYNYGPLVAPSGTKGAYSLQRVEDIHFNPASLVYQGGRFLAHAEDTPWFYESEPLDVTGWNELDYAVTSVKPDNLICLYEVNGDVFAMGKQSGEIYYQSGASAFSYAKMSGGNIPIGTKAPFSGAVFLGSLILLAPDRTIVQVATTPVKLSNEHVDRRLAAAGSVNNARAFVLNHRGHSFYVISVPDLDVTFVYDIVTQMWYEWGSNYGRWRPNCLCRYNDVNYAGDYSNGKIYIIDADTYDDDGDEIIVKHVVPIQKDNKRMPFKNFEIEMETGIGLTTGQGSDPVIMLRYSTDKGKTWSYERHGSIGKIGNYADRVRWRRLGRHYDFTAEISISDPIKVVITGAYLNG